MKMNRKWSPLKFIGSMLTASLIMFGAASCNQSSEPGEFEGPYDGPIEEGFAGDDGYTSVEPVVNPGVGYLESWDDNKDLRWDKQEFRAGLQETGLFNEWDLDDDGTFTEDEFNQGLFNEWDEDGNGYLSNEEYAIGNAAWEDDFGNNYDAWDINDDYILDSNEFNAGIGKTGLYSDWDTNDDNMFSEDEFYSGFYDSWDNNSDGFIDSNEYNTAGFANWY